MEEQQEIWKDIIIKKNGVIYDYTGLYEVSNIGRVRSLRDNHGKYRRKIMKCGHDTNGYCTVVLTMDGRQVFLVHRLVANAFIPNPNNLPVVNHRDECKSNNCVNNLEWCTVQQNTKYSSYTRKGLLAGDKNPNSKKVICLETKNVFTTVKKAKEWCGGDVAQCCNGRSKTAGGYHWMWYEDWLTLQKNEKNTK